MKEFIFNNSTEIMSIIKVIVMALFAYLGTVLKRKIDTVLNTKEKQAVAEDVVKFVEQVYKKDLHGPDKLAKATAAAAQILKQRGVPVTNIEIQVLIESALAKFNEAFKAKSDTSGADSA